MKRWKILEGLTLADVGFEAYGRNETELFNHAAMALMEIMVETKTVKPLENVKFQSSNVKIEDLLFDFLSEIVFLKDAKNMLFARFEINLNKRGSRYRLDATLWGEEIDPSKHHLRLDVKAITRHHFSVFKKKDVWIARVIVDI